MFDYFCHKRNRVLNSILTIIIQATTEEFETPDSKFSIKLNKFIKIFLFNLKRIQLSKDKKSE